jgi:hypothetical protein
MRATIEPSTPISAHTSQAGKYAPATVIEGADAQPPKRPADASVGSKARARRNCCMDFSAFIRRPPRSARELRGSWGVNGMVR